MKTISQKIRDRRCELGYSQRRLAELTGVSSRSIFAYEAGEKVPRQTTLIRLAEVLKVSAKYLTDDEMEQPLQRTDMRGDSFDSRKAEQLLADNLALFAGGEISQEEKDIFFESVMRAYISCKDASDKGSGQT